MISVSEILRWTGGRLANGDALGGDEARIGQLRLARPAPLGGARPDELAFFFNKAYQAELATAQPGALITGEPFVAPLQAAGLPLWKRAPIIACKDPYFAMALLSEKFAASISTVAHVPGGAAGGKAEIHESATVHPEAELGAGVRVGPGCVIEEGARVGAETVLYPGCYVGPRASIGRDCVLFPNVAIYEWTQIGDRVRVHAGSVLGSDGFGYAPRLQDGRPVGHQKIYHLGRVLVGDDAEIGALSCVDRGTFGDTVIGRHAKLDNQVHVGHNSRIDEGAVICGGTCLAGRASVGRYAYVGGLTGITNDVHVGDGGKVGALSLVTKDVPPGGTAVGNPQREHREHFRAHAALSRLAERKPSGTVKRGGVDAGGD